MKGRKILNIRIPEEAYRLCKLLAAQTDRPMGTVVARALVLLAREHGVPENVISNGIVENGNE